MDAAERCLQVWAAAPLLFWAHSQICEKLPLVSSCLCVHLSVHAEGLGSHWMNFYEIWYCNSGCMNMPQCYMYIAPHVVLFDHLPCSLPL